MWYFTEQVHQRRLQKYHLSMEVTFQNEIFNATLCGCVNQRGRQVLVSTGKTSSTQPLSDS